MYRMKQKLDYVIRTLEDLKSSIPDENDKLGSHPDHYPSLYFQHSSWECDGSPTKYCMYTTDYDCCIFCSQPEERK